MIRSNRRFLTVATATVLALTVGGLAFADDSENTESGDDAGSPWARTGTLWLPGSSTPPPWADGTEDDGDDDGEGARWLRGDADGWLPGDQGPPPWSNARWLRDDAEGWQPGDGKPPWAGKGGDDAEEGDDDGEGARWLRDDAEGWQPGDGKPPWAGQDEGDDDEGDDDEGDDDEGDDDEPDDD